MGFLHMLKQELNKTIWNIGFLFCILISAGLFFTNQAYIEPSGGKMYAVIEVMLHWNSEMVHTEHSFAAQCLLLNAVSGYLLMFIPILAAFPFIPNFCAERNSGMIRLVIGRTGKFRYYAGKFLSAMIGGGLAVLLGYLLYGVIIIGTFPDIKTYGDAVVNRSMYSWTNIAKCGAGILLYGACSAIPAFLMASFVKNRYLITCIPFMLVYLFSSGLTRMSYYGEETGSNLLMKLSFILRPDTVCYLDRLNADVKYALVINFIWVLVAFILFVSIMNRRWDTGE